MATRLPNADRLTTVEMHFPVAGLDLAAAFDTQPPRQVRGGVYARSTPIGLNVRGFEPGSGRNRGGSRPGLSALVPTPAVADWVVQSLSVMVTVENPVQVSNLGRVVSLIQVSQGNVYVARAGDTTFTAATNGTPNTPPLNFNGVLFAAPNDQKLWFADGTNWIVYDPATNTVNLWAPSAGLLPVDSAGNTPRLICTWRGRTVLSGLLLDPQNWFMSRVNDPTDWDYAPLSPSPTQAIAGNNSPLGLVGDVVTALIPYNDDILVFGGDHTIYTMTGDPMAGGQIDLVSDAIGLAWGQSWAKDPYGSIYFVSNKTGIYTMVPGQSPQRISQAIEQLLVPIDTGNNVINLIWNDRFQGLHVFVTPISAPGPAGAVTHFFYEQRTGAWWVDQYANINHDPLCVATFDGNQPGDRLPLIGCWDGYVRVIDPTATTDDGWPIASQVFIGPILTATADTMLLHELQMELGETSGDVTYAIYLGNTPEAAASSVAVESGTLSAGRNDTTRVRWAGHALYIGLSSSNPWAMEKIRAVIATRGDVRRRTKG